MHERTDSPQATTLRFLGAANTVTGSRYLLQTPQRRILIDCGLFQGYKFLRERNWKPFPVDPASIDAIVLTHAHLDHSGYVPALIEQGFTGKVYCSAGTAALCGILWPDAGHLQEEEAEFQNRHQISKHHPALPLYNEDQARQALHSLHVVNTHTPLRIGDIEILLQPNGHILGSCALSVNAAGKTLFFSGDVGRPHDALMHAPQPPLPADYLIVESTYGNRQHENVDVETKLADLINTTARKGGAILVPAFAVGRAQLVLYLLHRLRSSRRIPNLPVYLDSPMAISVTDLLHHHRDQHRLTDNECEQMCRAVHYTRTADESRALNDLTMPRIIISASGMATGGRVLHHLKYLLGDDRNVILFAGYQSGGTRGARLVGGEKEIKIHGRFYEVHARIENLDSLSAHADCDEIVQWLRHLPSAPKKTFVTHGEPEAADAMRVRLQNEFNWEACAPDQGDSFTL